MIFQDVQDKDLAGSSLEIIVDQVLEKMMESAQETVTRDELKSLIFSGEDRSTLANSLQGVECGDVNQNWIVSVTSVPSLNNRMIAVSRMERNTNLGEGANEIKYFILILCPTTIKGDHNTTDFLK